MLGHKSKCGKTKALLVFLIVMGLVLENSVSGPVRPHHPISFPSQAYSVQLCRDVYGPSRVQPPLHRVELAATGPLQEAHRDPGSGKRV